MSEERERDSKAMEDDGKMNGMQERNAASYQGFDPVAYLQYNYTPPRADFERQDSIVPWKLGCLHRAFTEGGERVRVTYLSV